MKPEIKHALEVIRDECRKHGYCDRCELINPRYYFGNGEMKCLIGDQLPWEWNIEAWEKESKK